MRQEDIPNLNQMIDAVSRDGFVIAQEFLPAAEQGDMRLFVMNGRPLCVKRKYAAFRRVRSGGDMRSNIHAGGQKGSSRNRPHRTSYRRNRPTKTGSGRDVSGGLGHRGRQIDGDQCVQPRRFGKCPAVRRKSTSRSHVIEAIERKVQYMHYYGRNFDNVDMCTLITAIKASSDRSHDHPIRLINSIDVGSVDYSEKRHPKVGSRAPAR